VNPVIFLSNVPWWVFPLLALLVWRGWHASKSRTVPIRAIFIGPAIFIGWGIANLVTRALTAPNLAAVWFVAAAIGAGLGLMTVRLAVQADRAKGMVRLPGSWAPLARYLAIFCAKFVLAAWSAMQPAMRSELAYWDVGVSGLSAGYFIGWLVCVLREYRSAPSIAPGDGLGDRLRAQ
jgi:Ni/Fe-hydrogenase subunit HybB-like protein